jgi:hypothetical protein
MLPMSARSVRLLVVALTAAMVSACGYALAGRGNALPADIVRIGVPYFINQSSEPDIERVLGDAVRAEFQSKGKYRVQPDDAGADGLLTGTVVQVELRPTAYTPERLPSAFALVVTANVEFKNMRDNGAVLWANPFFRVADEYQVTSENNVTDVTAFFTQNPNAKERLARRFARDVVTAIFEAF